MHAHTNAMSKILVWNT